MNPSSTSYAHHGEDLAVLAFFGERPGVFVEAGANHPVRSSQTYLLEQRGWHGVLIEPNPELAALCRQLRPQSRTFDCALVEPGGPAEVHLGIPAAGDHEVARIDPTSGPGGSGFTCRTSTLDAVLAEAGVGTIDFFSIDLEGYEVPALRGFDWRRWRPRLLSIEDHCESLATHRAVKAQGYRFLRRIGDNDWYVPGDSPHRPTAGELIGMFRKKYLSLPFRKFRRLVRRWKGLETA